jgi:DNA replication protein DnaC
LFTRTSELIKKLQAAKRDLSLPSALDKLDKFDCLILDDFGYVQRDSLETSVLFELISDRYERKSLIVTCNQPFGEWDKIFVDKTMAVAAIDRLIHRAIILELNEESYRKKAALTQKNNKEVGCA